MGMIVKEHPLYQKLNELKLIDGLDLQGQAIGNPEADIPDLIVSHGLATLPGMLLVLEDFYNLPGIFLGEFKSEFDALSLASEDICKEMSFIPLAQTDDRICLAMADPWDIDARNFVEMKTGKVVDPIIAIKSDINGSVDKQYGSSEVLSQAIQNLVGDVGMADDSEMQKPDFQIEWEDAPVIKLVNYIFQQGISLRASDIHLEPEENSSNLRYRIDGVLHKYPSPPPEIYKAVVSRIKVLANLDVTESRFPQDGRISFKMGIRTIDFRISIIPFYHGEGVDIRILDKSRVSLDLDSLGFPEDQYKQYSKAFNSPHGLILVSGPTGSGKTTTLYATLKIVATPDKKTITIEDPVEYDMKGIEQSQVREDIGYNFAMGLRAMLRHDPDIMMIGEMRDLESAEIGVRSALTGHLVFSTIHTNDSVSAITRLTDMGIKPYLVSAVLQMVLAQRLVRRLCKKCRKLVSIEKKKFEELGLDKASLDELDDNVKVYEPVGCKACKNLGYLGRIGIFEILDAEKLFRHTKEPNMTLQDMTDLALKLGMRNLRASGLKRVIEGTTSLKEILKVTADY
ncbi:MAG: GspE/PulE family protein [Candidatus Eremiobacteraeota bacterium]|nr:GspE/PulE family protein [Candidatus Eremiobacteraeota bacterium]